MTPPPPPPPPPPPGGTPPPPPTFGAGPPPYMGGGNSFGPASPTGQPLAEPIMRVLARALDFVILAIAISVIVVPIVLSDVDDAGFGGVGGDVSVGTTLAINVIALVAYVLWDVVCPKIWGGSPMKLAFGMRIVRADNGGAITWGHAIKRIVPAGVLSLIPVVGGLLRLIIAIVSLIFLFSKPLRQTVADQFAGTLVVKRR